MSTTADSIPRNGTPEWMGLSAEALRQNTCVFASQPGAKNIDIAEALFDQSFHDAICVQITARSTKVTFLTETTLTRLCDAGHFSWNDYSIPVKALVSALTEIQLFDIPLWVDGAIVREALAPYGELKGKIRHGQSKTKNGMIIATGVKFAYFKKNLATHVPSFVKTMYGNSFRVRYEGQPDTCRKCGQQGHFAAACTTTHGNHASSTTGTIGTPGTIPPYPDVLRTGASPPTDAPPFQGSSDDELEPDTAFGQDLSQDGSTESRSESEKNENGSDTHREPRQDGIAGDQDDTGSARNSDSIPKLKNSALPPTSVHDLPRPQIILERAPLATGNQGDPATAAHDQQSNNAQSPLHTKRPRRSPDGN